MTVEDTARALMAMDDPERRAAVAKGQFDVLGDLDLSREEQRLLLHAAHGDVPGDDDDVEGFGAFAPPYVPIGPVVSLMGAIRYVEDGLGEAPLRQDFNQWTAKIGAQGTW